MENVLKMIKSTISTSKENPSEEDVLLTEIRNVCKQISCTERWFQMENDSDLIDACIHQREGLYARYRYLMRKAKSDNIYVSPFKSKCV